MPSLGIVAVVPPSFIEPSFGREFPVREPKSDNRVNQGALLYAVAPRGLSFYASFPAPLLPFCRARYLARLVSLEFKLNSIDYSYLALSLCRLAYFNYIYCNVA